MTLNDNLTPALQRFCAPIPREVVGAGGERGSEVDRDQAALELVGYVTVILKFGLPVGYRAELLKRANKVRQSQGYGEVTFVAETAARMMAATQPGYTAAAFEDLEAELSRQMAEPNFDGDLIGAP